MEILDENPDLFVLNKWIMNRRRLECNHHLTVRTLSSLSQPGKCEILIRN